MNFLALIIAVVLDRFSGLGGRLRCNEWFRHWQVILEGLGLGGWLYPVVSVLGPVVLAGLLLQAVSGALFGLAWIALASVIVLYSFGRGDLDELQAHYRSQSRREDFQGAWIGVQAGIPGFEIEGATDAEGAHAMVQRAFLYQSYQRWFGVLFYYLPLGPLGALAYRLVQLMYAGERNSPVLYWLDWLPARALAATFAITGNFSAGIDKLWELLRTPSVTAEALLHTVAGAAADRVDGDFSGQLAARQNETQSALLRRSAVCWIAVISLLVIVA